MREIRTSGSEGGGTSVLPTPIPVKVSREVIATARLGDGLFGS